MMQGNCLGSLAKKSKKLWFSPAVHLKKSGRSTPLPLPYVLASQLPQIMAKMKDYVSTKDSANTRKLSKTRKFGLLAESAFQLLRAGLPYDPTYDLS